MSGAITLTAHAVRRAEKRLGLNVDDLRKAVAKARHTGAARDGLECWRSGEALLMLYPVGMAGRPPLRIEVVTVLAGPDMLSAVHRAARGQGRGRWRAAEPVADLWARRGTR